MILEKISAKTIRQEVYEQLRDKIISAEILPGESISLRDLAGKFGVSLMPVREALWQLESEKIIVVESNKRIRVNSLTGKEMEEALHLRVMLESVAAERACDLMAESDIPKLRRLVENMEASRERPKIFMRRNTQFHFMIYSLADSPLLLEMIERLWARVGPYVYSYVIGKQDLSRSMASHWEIFEGLAAKDKKRIVKGLREDLEIAGKIIISDLKASVEANAKGNPAANL
jgi:DNA-binding GntR family transcriptional regulator